MSQARFTPIPEVSNEGYAPICGFRVWSLLDVKRFYAEKLASLSTTLGILQVMASDARAAHVPAGARSESAPILDKVLALCQEADLPVTAALARRMQEAVRQGITAADFGKVVSDLSLRFEDELASILFFRIPNDRAQLYQGSDLFGADVASAFPSARYDIEEAGRALATGRSTACVFHLMRVLETVLRALCATVGLTPGEKNWQNLLEQIEKAVKQPQFQPDLPFYRAVLDRLRAVKDAWRNDTMHVRGKYSEEEATEAFTMVKAFVRRLPPKITETI